MNTVGLGEYTDAELLAELEERGVMQRVIGEDVPIDDAPDKIGLLDGEHWLKGMTINTIKLEQRKRIQDILKGESDARN